MQGGCTARAWSSIEPMQAGHADTSSIHGDGATVGQALRMGRRRWQGRMWRLVHVGTATWLVARRQVCAGLVDGAM